MSRSDLIALNGKIVEVLATGKFKVKPDDIDQIVIAHLSGKMRQFKIKLVLGDKVVCEVSPYDSTRGRIVRRK